MVNLNWTSAIDFDLFAVYETKTGNLGIVYYADTGDLNTSPYMLLSDDEGVGDMGGDNQESLIISSLSEMKYVWVCAWDYNAVTQSRPGRFDGSDLNMTVIDDQGEYKIPLVDQRQGNTALVLTIDNTSPVLSRLINSSEVTTLLGLQPNDLIQFLKSSLQTLEV
jgi:tellurite resistance protein TerA